MLALEAGGEIVVIDGGILFPEEGMPGIDFVLPDITYLLENKRRVKAILVTHGHEDHIGALPYVLPQLDVPVYCSRLTHGLITVKLREHGKLRDAKLNVVEPHSPIKVGRFIVEFFRVCHSIPDAMGIAVTTPLGMVVHTGDFKIDHTPVDGRPTDFTALAGLTRDGVLLMLSDSTYAEVEGYTPSEQIVGAALERVIGQAEGRIMVASFASLISRMQQVIDAAVRHGRKVAVIGRSMRGNLNMALKMGYLNAPSGTIVTLNEARRLPNEQIVILATGSQGEPTSALVRIANGEHQDIEIVPGDTVVISASPIPGNETLVSRTIDNLFRQGAKVLHSRTALVHVHGHASAEELKMMLNLVRPKYFVPVHGEYRHLVAHVGIAQSLGVPAANTFVLEDGDVLELTDDGGKVVDQVPAGHVYMDGKVKWSTDSIVLEERSRLGRDGVVVVAVTIDGRTGEIRGEPEASSSGFAEDSELERLFEIVAQNLRADLSQQQGRGRKLDRIQSRIKQIASDVILDETGKRPTVITLVKRL